MCALPIVEGSQIQTAPNAARMDTTALRDAALAPGRVGAAAGDAIGGFFSDVSQKIQQNRNARMVFDADLKMRKTKDDFTASLASMPDETTWLPAWKQQVDQVRDSVADNPHAGPDVRQMLNQKFNLWEEATTAETRTAALIKGVKESRDSGIAAATYAANQGDLEGANTTVKAMVENHAMSAGEAAKFSSRFPTIAAHAQADLLISADPINAPDQIKKLESEMEPRMFVRIQATARAAQSAAQTQNLDQWAQQMDASPDGTIDPDALRADVSNKKLTQRGMNSLMARMDQTRTKTDKETKSVLMLRADDTDWLNVPDVAKRAQELKELGAVLPEGLRVPLYEHIDAKVRGAKKLGETDEKPVQTDAYARGKEAFRQGLFQPGTEVVHSPGMISSLMGFFGKDVPPTTTEIKPPDVDNEWEKNADPKARAAAELNYAKWQDSMRGFFKDNPKATSEDAALYSQKLLQPHVMSAVKQALAPNAPPAQGNISKKDYEALPSGAEYQWNGKRLKKK